MARHDQKAERKHMICSNCNKGECGGCVDVTRILAGLEGTVCRCRRKGHGGEPRDQQILDPETGTVHAPGLSVTKDGEVKKEFCSSCGSDAPHHLAFVREKGLCVT